MAHIAFQEAHRFTMTYCRSPKLRRSGARPARHERVTVDVVADAGDFATARRRAGDAFRQRFGEGYDMQIVGWTIEPVVV